MSDDVRDFLIDLASDADRQARFKANPAKELALTKLNDEERGTVMSGDASRIRRLVNADDNGAPNLSAAGSPAERSSARVLKASALRPPRKRGSLVVVGTGIKLIAHTTREALDAITRAERLFFLVDDPATEEWLRRLNPSATSMRDLYHEGKPRRRTYDEMARRLVAAVRSGVDVCAVFYGHPGVFVDPSHDAIRRLKRAGYPARMLPGISTADCLFADLGVDPGGRGCQSFEATDFLLHQRRFDPTSALILWQIGVLGERSVRQGMTARVERIEMLVRVLREAYPARHRVVLYEAAKFPVCEPVIKRVVLSRLSRTPLRPVTTVYVPPLGERRENRAVARWFNER
jgi:uncharacterized protein YabN with tetrapyrrole methylase and pyrophosphatase domain